MNNIFTVVLACMFIFLTGCASTKKIEKTVTYDYSNIIFTPGEVEKTLQNKVEVTCIPLDAALLNQETFEGSYRNGNYEQEVKDEIERITYPINLSPKEVDKRKRYVKDIFEEIQKLEKENSLPAYAAYLLKLRILRGEKYGSDGSESTWISTNDIYPDAFNPYKINQKYLSVFKITFENKGNEIEKIKLKDLQIISGEELLYPLANTFFEKELDGASEKLKNIFRMNMPEELVITPSQKVTKYISVPAINTKNENLKIQLIKDKEVLNFDFNVKEVKSKLSKEYEKFTILPVGLTEPSFNDIFYLISYQNGVQFATIGPYFFIEKTNKSMPLTLSAVAIERYNFETRSTSQSNLILNEFKRNSIYAYLIKPAKKKKKNE